ncbi:MAG: hypothetical protein EBE86_010310 [Hormoscilla sp. GUM202]|nr:hypothetical protein [Hormoscilla sp. GUM202]
MKYYEIAHTPLTQSLLSPFNFNPAVQSDRSISTVPSQSYDNGGEGKLYRFG